jgi:hypothetical protein
VALKKRSEAGTREPPWNEVRTPDGHINNCALANGVGVEDCQMCLGKCPDESKFAMPILASHKSEKHWIPSKVGTSDQSEQQAGEQAFAEAAGERVEVTWGAELFQPVQYNDFRVGPFSASTIVRPRESIAEATVRLHREISVAAQHAFEEKSARYLENLAGLASKVRNTQVR